MDQRSLGTTGLHITPIGFGAFKIGRNVGTKYAQGYDLPSDEDAERLLNRVLDLGINLIDTAPAYGVSEDRIGSGISHRRDEFVLSTKVGETFGDGASHFDFSAEAIRLSLDASRKRLRNEVLDIVLVHSDGRDVEIQTTTDVVDVLIAEKDAGRIRAIGFSGKTTAGAVHAIGWSDVLMVEYHVEDQTHRDIISMASEAGLGVLVKKGLASGSLSALEAIPFVLANPGVHGLVIGGLNPDHIAKNIAIAELALRSPDAGD